MQWGSVLAPICIQRSCLNEKGLVISKSSLNLKMNLVNILVTKMTIEKNLNTFLSNK